MDLITYILRKLGLVNTNSILNSEVARLRSLVEARNTQRRKLEEEQQLLSTISQLRSELGISA